MFIKNLLSIYTDAYSSKVKISSDDVICIQVGQDFIVIPTQKLSKTEKIILNTLKNENSQRSVWYHYLMNDGSKPNQDAGRVIHFKTKHISDPALYLETLSTLFETVIDAFFISEKTGYIITQDKTVDIALIEAQLDLMDDDFSTVTSLYVGTYLNVDTSFKKAFEEETRLFLSSNQKVSTYTTTFMNYHFSEIVAESSIAKMIQASINKIEDGEKVIQMLWTNHGNLSKTAQALYIHRNTLNYRLDKFYEDTQLNLRTLSDLVLCYWIINSQ